jgi:sugar fermentation stimulation protein A
MKFSDTYIEGILIKRYKRFLADIELENGTVITAHTPNTGAMTGCSTPGSRVWLRDTGNPDRKYPYSWEIVEARPDVLVGIHTGLSNKLVQEAIENGVIKELQNYQQILTEVPYGNEKSRIDLLLRKNASVDSEQCYVEVKNVTLVEDNIAWFPDAVTVRGTKHLRELMKMVEQGHRAVIFYCVQRHDVVEFRPAKTIDPIYSETLLRAVQAGVEAMAYIAEVSTEEIKLTQAIPVAITNGTG